MSTDTSTTRNAGKKPYSLANPMVVDGVFYIPSEALLPGINKLVLKDNELFAILDETGESPRIYDRELGFYFQDTRFLDTWELTLNGSAATPLSHDAREHSRVYRFVLTNKDLVSIDYQDRVPRDRLRILRTMSLEGDQAVEHLEIMNYDAAPHTIEVERRAASRFNDIFEVRGMKRERRGEIRRPEVSDDRRTVTLSYVGLDGKRYATVIASSLPMTDVVAEDNGVLMTHRVVLKPREAVALKFVMDFTSRHAAPTASKRGLEAAKGGARLAFPKFETDDPLLNRVFATAQSDIQALLTRRGGVLYPDAGIPWFCAPFGRDGLITAYQLLPWCPEIAEGVLDVAFSTLGTKVDAFTDEEPGKVFHENRFGEMAALREIPFVPYYGSVDSTPLALLLLAEYAQWTKRLDFVSRTWEKATAATSWVLDKMARDPRGFLTYQAGSKRGLRNQGWKDSHDSVMHADGRLAEPPIALAEVQGYGYRALLEMARLARALGKNEDAERWRDEAAALRARFRAHFYDSQRGALALALDGDGRACHVLASNMGHCLWTGIVDERQAREAATHLLGEPMFSGYGIRTLATVEAAYNPLSYHNGSVWPHDNALIAEGLRNFDLGEDLVTLASAQLEVARSAPDYRLPELFCGFPRDGVCGPVPYDVACKPQAWAAGSPFLLVKALLGLHMNPEGGALIFRAPLLPAQVNWLAITGLRVLDFELDLLVRRGRVTSTVEVLRTTGGAGRVLVVK